jgi:hypothetical protein
MTECNYLNPDVEVIAEINTTESFETFAESINTGHGLVGTTHAGDIETLVNRIVEQGLPPYLLREIDLVVFPRRVEGERYVGEVVELLDADAYESLDPDSRCGCIEKQGVEIYWNTVAWRTESGGFAFAYDHPNLGDDSHGCDVHAFSRIATLTDRPTDAVEDEFHRKHRYVEHMVREDIDDFDALFELLADLQTNEAATVERLSRQASDDETEGAEPATETGDGHGVSVKHSDGPTVEAEPTDDRSGSGDWSADDGRANSDWPADGGRD